MTNKIYNYSLDISRIKKERIKKNLTQKDFANILNIKPSNYSNYENSKEAIPIEHFNNICNFLKISFDYALNLTSKNTYQNNIILDKTKIGQRLKEFRKENNLYQDTIAKEIGTSKSLICEYEKGVKLLSISYSYAICSKYDLSMDWLYGKTDSPKYLK